MCIRDSRRGRRRARRGRGGRGRARGLDRVNPLCRTPGRSRLGDGRRGSRGFCGSRADLGGYGEDRSEIVVGCRQSPPAAGVAIDGGDGCRNTSDECFRKSRKVVNPHTWPVCAKIAEIAGGESTPPKTVLSVRGTRARKPTPRIAEKGVFSPQARMRYIPPSSTRLKLVDPLRSYSVTGSRTRDRKSSMRFAHSLRYSRV